MSNRTCSTEEEEKQDTKVCHLVSFVQMRVPSSRRLATKLFSSSSSSSFFLSFFPSCCLSQRQTFFDIPLSLVDACFLPPPPPPPPFSSVLCVRQSKKNTQNERETDQFFFFFSVDFIQMRVRMFFFVLLSTIYFLIRTFDQQENQLG